MCMFLLPALLCVGCVSLLPFTPELSAARPPHAQMTAILPLAARQMLMPHEPGVYTVLSAFERARIQSAMLLVIQMYCKRAKRMGNWDADDWK